MQISRLTLKKIFNFVDNLMSDHIGYNVAWLQLKCLAKPIG